MSRGKTALQCELDSMRLRQKECIHEIRELLRQYDEAQREIDEIILNVLFELADKIESKERR